MKVVIAGAGIAGNCMLRQLCKRPDIHDLKAYEQRSARDASPPGLNVVMNHNGMAAIREMDPNLYDLFWMTGGTTSGSSSGLCNWSARTVTGQILYHLTDVVASGDAATPAMVARWDYIHQATRCDELTEYSTKVVEVQQDDDNDKLRIRLERPGATSEEWVHGIDVLIAADGRYSTIREQLAPTDIYFGPPYIADFRLVIHDMHDIDDFLTPQEPMWRVYNRPCLDDIRQQFQECESSHAMMTAASNHVRVGIMKLGDDCLGVFGNIAIPEPSPDGSTSFDDIKRADFMAALFETTVDPPDRMGQMVIDMLRRHGQNAHWTRKQETETCYQALGGRVLFIGDAAGAIYPTLGQGANLSLEDVAVAAAAFPNVALISELRHERREFIKLMSRQNAMHVAFPELYDQEMENWSNPQSQWRADLKRLWGCGPQFALKAQVATKENIAEFGQLITECLDGNVFDPVTSDARLYLSQGTPRLYYMKLTGGRPLVVDRITRHNKVTQCLGALESDTPFYMVLHAPTTTDHPPTLNGLKAFQIPPRHFLKLDVGTWHAGPMWDGPDDSRTFINLELADTNVADHDTVILSSLPPHGDGTSNNASSSSRNVGLRIPILAVLNDKM